jgi:hypothetical protein
VFSCQSVASPKTTMDEDGNEVMDGQVKILKIDSVDNTYVYHAQLSHEKHKLYRILTKKEANHCQNPINVGGYYQLKLINPLGYIKAVNHIGFYSFNNTRVALKKEGFSEIIYITDDIKGLCYRPVK